MLLNGCSNNEKFANGITVVDMEGKTFILTTHNPNHLANLKCDIFTIKDKNICQIANLDKATVERIYGSEFVWYGKSFLFEV